MVVGVLINVLLTVGFSFFDIEILKYISSSLESLGWDDKDQVIGAVLHIPSWLSSSSGVDFWLQMLNFDTV